MRDAKPFMFLLSKAEHDRLVFDCWDATGEEECKKVDNTGADRRRGGLLVLFPGDWKILPTNDFRRPLVGSAKVCTAIVSVGGWGSAAVLAHMVSSVLCE